MNVRWRWSIVGAMQHGTWDGSLTSDGWLLVSNGWVPYASRMTPAEPVAPIEVDGQLSLLGGEA